MPGPARACLEEPFPFPHFAIFIPLAIDLCQRFHISPTKILMPLSYAAIFGGTLTLIGTSTNLVVSSIMEELNIKSFSMFEFTKVGLVFILIGMVYILIISRWFLPSRAITTSLTQKYHVQKYLTEFKVPKDSKLIGKSFNYMQTARKYGFQAYKIIRDDQELIYNLNSAIIYENDVIIGKIQLDQLMKLKKFLK